MDQTGRLKYAAKNTRSATTSHSRICVQSGLLLLYNMVGNEAIRLAFVNTLSLSSTQSVQWWLFSSHHACISHSDGFVPTDVTPRYDFCAAQGGRAEICDAVGWLGVGECEVAFCLLW